jgi:hypothetical protein
MMFANLTNELVKNSLPRGVRRTQWGYKRYELKPVGLAGSWWLVAIL